jgi:tagatose 6-phosphate kinase
VILVVALNPALDITHEVDGVEWGAVNRPSAVHASPGGKGANVAQVLRALGVGVHLIGLAGGHTGSVLAAALSAADIPVGFTKIAGETRRTFAVVDTRRGSTAVFNEPGPIVSGAEYAAFLACYADALPASSAVVMSGSLPPGLAAQTYADLITMAAQTGVPVLLDTSGDALVLGAAAGPAILKPNVTELLAAVGRGGQYPAAGDSGDRVPVEAVADAATELRDRGADSVVVTLGADGMLAVTAEGTWLAGSRPVTGNPTGAGDAVAAGLARGLVHGYPWATRLSHAAALGAAAVAAPVAGQITHAAYERALADVEVSSWERS